MNCPKCGNPVQDDANFCDRCGAPLTMDEASPGPSVEQQTVLETSAEAAVPTADVEQPPAETSQEPTQAEGAACPQCGAINVPGEMFCQECGAPLEALEPEPDAVQASGGDEFHCPACGAALAEGDTYCYACGARLDKTAASPQGQTPATETVAPTPMETPARPPQQRPDTQAPQATRQQPQPAQQTVTCPSCGAQVAAGESFCDVCGAALVQPAAGPAQVAPSGRSQPTVLAGIETGTPSLILSTGQRIALPHGQEVTVGREDPYSGVFPDVDLTPYGAEEAGVSRQHFRVTLGEGEYAIQDLNSTNFTLLNRQRLTPGEPHALCDGDEIRAGRLTMTFRVS